MVNDGPTRMHGDGSMRKLDLIIEPEHSRRLSAVNTSPVGYSDHWLVKAQLIRAAPPASRVTYTYRDFKRLDIMAFRNFLRQSVLMTLPSLDPDKAARQLITNITVALDPLAPLRSRSKRQSVCGNQWLSPEVRSARIKRRRLERRYSKT